MSLRSVLLCSIGVFGLLGCDSEPPPVDGGFDAGFEVDAGQPLTCSSVMQLTGLLDGSVTATFDTSMTLTRPRDLGLVCGNTDPELRWAPQEVIEFTVPGDPGSTYAVEFTTNQPGTDANFNTVVQVRDSCEIAPTSAFPPACFNDIARDEFRTNGSATVAGGSVLFFIVTGFSEPPAEQMTVDSGTVEVSFTVRGAEPPTITGGFFRLANDDSRIQLTGMDPNADVRGVGLNFYGPDGELLDIYGDGQATEDGDVYVVNFDSPAATGFDWTGGAWVRGAEVNLAAYLRGRRASQVRYRVFDAAWGISEPFDVTIDEATLVGIGETCDDENFCRPEMVCSSGACVPGTAIGQLCDRATDIVVPATPEMGATITQMGTTGGGMGLITVDAACVADPNGTIGAETVYKLDVAVDNFDLDLSTDNPGTGMTDTILYVRGECPDSGSVLACNDDAAPMNLQSTITLTDLTAGTYYVFVERYGGLMSGTVAHSLDVTVTPVVPMGGVCDPATTRCAAGTCTMGMCS